ncbi:MAG: ADOP family duplicated permease, partial [Gemmatimonadota bacterium]
MRTLRIAFRTLIRRPSFTAVAVLVLALGLGGTAALFTLVNSVLLAPLPYDEPGELVRVFHEVPGFGPGRQWGLSERGWFALRDGNTTFEEIGVYQVGMLGLAGEGVAAPVRAARVSASLVDVLGARPSLGRLFREEDQAMHGPEQVVLSHELWRTRFGGDPTILGRVLRIEGHPAEVVGVMEPGFSLPEGPVDIWTPVRVSRENEARNSHPYAAIGRLRDGATHATATADLRRIVARFPELMPRAYHDDFMTRSGFTARVVDLKEAVVGHVAGSLWILLAAVGLVLLIGCANVANLFLVRLEASRREQAVRLALGASFRDRARTSLAESSLIAAVAVALGLLMAWWGVELLLRMGWELPRVSEVAVGTETVIFTVCAAALIALVFGLLPALRAGAAFGALREGVGLTPSRRRRLVRSGLVVGEMALALVVLAAAGLMVRSFQRLQAVDPGIDPTGVLTVQVGLPAAGYAGHEPVALFFRSLTERVGGLPGVAAVGATQQLPLDGRAGCSGIAAADREAETSGCFASTVHVTPGYFEAMGIEVEGEAPGWAEVMERRGHVVVSRPLAEHVWSGREPLGQGIKSVTSTPPFYEVTGVAAPVRHDGLSQPPVERVYYPMIAMDGAPLWGPPRQMTLVIRVAAGRPEALAAPVREIIADLDPTAAIGEIRTMDEVVARSTAPTAFAMLLLAIAAAVALALGVIGLYGVVAYAVEQRRSEIGIRIDLGARAREVLLMVVGQA